LLSIHLNSDYMMEFEANGDQQIIYFLSIVAFLILVIAWVNYINLSTSMSLSRMKEIGIRKVIGSSRQQLIFQFILESFSLTSIAILLSLGLVYFFLPAMNSITGRTMTLFNLAEIQLWVEIIMLFVAGGIASGIYPAFIVSSFKPAEVLKGKSKKSSGNIMRRVLVIFQFAVSIILIVGTFVVFRQLHFLRQQKLGVDIDQTLVIVGPNVGDSTYTDKHTSFKIEALRLPSVSAITASTTVPGTQPPWNAGGIRKIQDDPSKGQQYRVVGMDADYADYYGLKIIAGRNFSQDYPNEKNSVLFNESAYQLMGFASLEEAIGQEINFWGDTLQIVGIVQDYHHESYKKNIEPLIFRYYPFPSSYFSIRVNAGHYQEAIRNIGTLYSQFFPGNEYDYFFLDDHFNQQYQSEVLFGKIFGSFSTLAIIIACLGLFGLTSFVTTQRTREIGIRKTLGASRPELILLLSKEFSRLVFVSLVPALPLVWWLSRQWLSNFASQTNLSWWLFVIPGIVVFLIAWATISYHTLRISSINPTETLRTE